MNLANDLNIGGPTATVLSLGNRLVHASLFAA